jgi:membrane protease YdiL (CAAX protease family)
MMDFIKRLSPTAEIAIVLTVAFGLFVWGAIDGFVNPSPPSDTPFTNDALMALTLVELVLFALLLPFLKVRGWTRSAIGLAPAPGQTLMGFALTAGTIAIFALTNALAHGNAAEPAANPALKQAADLSLWTILAVSLVNAAYEEIFVTGYLISAVKEKWPAYFAIALSTGLRGLYHLYQGLVPAIAIGAMGLMFAIYYARSGKLWPLIVAHFILDVLSFAMPSDA